MATLPTIAKSKKVLILKIVFNVTVFLAVIGAFVGFSFYSQSRINDILAQNGVSEFEDLSANLQLVYNGFEKYVWHTKINPAIVMPVGFVGIAAFMVFKDEIKKYFKLPKGVGGAIIILGISFIIEYIATYVQVAAASYLFVTLINALYFDPLIEKIEKAEGTGQ